MVPVALARRLAPAPARPQVPGPVRALVQDRLLDLAPALAPALALVRVQELGPERVRVWVQGMGKGKGLDMAKGMGRARDRVLGLARDTVREVDPVEDLATAKAPVPALAKDQDPATVKVTAPVMAKALDTVRVQEEDTEMVQAQATARDTATATALVLGMWQINMTEQCSLLFLCINPYT